MLTSEGGDPLLRTAITAYGCCGATFHVKLCLVLSSWLQSYLRVIVEGYYAYAMLDIIDGSARQSPIVIIVMLAICNDDTADA